MSENQHESNEKSDSKGETIAEGDFVLIDFIGRTLDEPKRVFAITREEDAKKEQLYKEDGVYQPQAIIVGKEMVVPGLDEAIVGMKIGETNTVKIEPEKGYGERDPRQIQPYPARKLKRKGVQLYRGARVRVEGREGTIVMVGGGRVRVDFNHPLAGKSLEFEVTINQKIEDLTEKIQAITNRVIPRVSIDEFGFEISEDQKSLDIVFPQYLMFVEGISVSKFSLARELNTYLGFDTVRLIDKFEMGGSTTDELSTTNLEESISSDLDDEEE